MKNIRVFLSENFQYLEVKFSIYLNRNVFVMIFPQTNLFFEWLTNQHRQCSNDEVGQLFVITIIYEELSPSLQKRDLNDGRKAIAQISLHGFVVFYSRWSCIRAFFRRPEIFVTTLRGCAIWSDCSLFAYIQRLSFAWQATIKRLSLLAKNCDFFSLTEVACSCTKIPLHSCQQHCKLCSLCAIIYRDFRENPTFSLHKYFIFWNTNFSYQSNHKIWDN